MSIFKLFSNKHSWSCIIWSTVQQLTVALSTYAIIQSIQSVSEKNQEKTIFWLVIFATSLVIVYLPNVLATIKLEKSRIKSFENFMSAFVNNNWGASHIAHPSIKADQQAWITHEATQSINEATNILFSLFGTLLSATLNVGVIAIAIDKRIAVWYTIAGLFLISINFLFKNKIKTSSLSLQIARKNMSEKLLTAWENILIGNKHNYLNWSANFNKKIKETKKETIRYELIRTLVSSGSVVGAVLLIAYGNGVVIKDNWNNWTIISALIATMPRQMQTIQFTFALFNILLSWQGIKERLLKLINILKIEKTYPIEETNKYISWPKITIKGDQNINSLNLLTIVDDLKATTKGRYTLRGPNGAGKSTLLRRIKKELQDACFYLPAKFNDLEFKTLNISNFSDGEKLRSVFSEISELGGVKYLLLDEWDANLDDKNMSQISKEIDNLCQSIIVIESRHRNETADVML